MTDETHPTSKPTVTDRRFFAEVFANVQDLFTKAPTSPLFHKLLMQAVAVSYGVWIGYYVSTLYGSWCVLSAVGLEAVWQIVHAWRTPQ